MSYKCQTEREITALLNRHEPMAGVLVRTLRTFSVSALHHGQVVKPIAMSIEEVYRCAVDAQLEALCRAIK